MSAKMALIAVITALAITAQAVDVQVPPDNSNNLGNFTATMFQPNDQVSDLLKWGVAMGVIGAKSKKLAKAIRGPRECWKNSQCPELRPYCLIEPSVGTPAETCVQCRTDSDCPEFQRPCSNVTNTCKPLVVPLTSVVVTYSGEGVTVQSFTAADKAQVCANLLALAGLTTQNAICTVIAVLPGSVVVVAEVRALGGSPEDFASIDALTTTLTEASPTTLDSLSNGISQSPTATVDSVEEGTSSIDTSLPTPVIPTAPLNVQANFPANGQCVDSAQVGWTAPLSDGGASIGSYIVACSSGTTSVAVTVSGTTTSAQVGPLASSTTYNCGVVAVNAAGASTQSNPSPPFTTSIVPSQPLQPTTSAIADEPLDQLVTWVAPTTAATCPFTSSTVECISSDGGATVQLSIPVSTTVSGDSTSATVTGLTLGATYTCTVTCANSAGSSLPSIASTSFVAGCGCEDQNQAYVLLPQPAAGVSNPEGCWYKSDMRSTATADIVSLASETGTYATALVSTAPTGTTSAIKLVTPLSDNAAKAGVALNYGNLGALLGTTFKTLVADPTFAVKYDWFKASPCTAAACNEAAAPVIRLILYSAGAAIDGTAIRGNYNTLVWEPYYNSPYNGGVGSYLNQWRSETILALTGTNNPVTGSNGANQGWWETSSGWGDAAYRVNGGGTQRNLAQWSAYYSSLSATLDDAVIVEVQVGIGSFNAGLVTFVNNVELSKDSTPSDTCVFESP